MRSEIHCFLFDAHFGVECLQIGRVLRVYGGEVDAFELQLARVMTDGWMSGSMKGEIDM